MGKKQSPTRDSSRSARGREITRSEGLLAQLLLHSLGEVGQKKKALTLKAAGFSNSEIAQLMGISPDSVAVVLYQARKEGRAGTVKKRATKGSKTKLR